MEANVFAVGSSDIHQHPVERKSEFVPIPPSLFENERIKHAACGYANSFFLTESNQLYCCGQNSSGELGIGYESDNEPLLKNKTVLPHYGNIEKIMGGDTFTFFIMKDGTFWRCGSNDDGQLGAGSKTGFLTPEPLESIPWGNSRVTKIAFGYYHSAVLVSNTLYITGKLSVNETTYEYSKIKDDDEKMIGKIVDVSCGVFNVMVVNNKGDLYSIGQSIDSAPTSQWTRMNIDSPISKIFCGSLLNVAISTRDEVFVGDDGNGLPNFTKASFSKWTMHQELSHKGIITFGIHTYQAIIVTRSGQCYVWGENGYNQLGTTSLNTSDQPQRSSQLEELCRKFSNKTAFVSGGLEHMIIYFADEIMSKGKAHMVSMLYLASKSHQLADISFKLNMN